MKTFMILSLVILGCIALASGGKLNNFGKSVTDKLLHAVVGVVALIVLYSFLMLVKSIAFISFIDKQLLMSKINTLIGGARTSSTSMQYEYDARELKMLLFPLIKLFIYSISFVLIVLSFCSYEQLCVVTNGLINQNYDVLKNGVLSNRISAQKRRYFGDENKFGLSNFILRIQNMY